MKGHFVHNNKQMWANPCSQFLHFWAIFSVFWNGVDKGIYISSWISWKKIKATSEVSISSGLIPGAW